MKQAIILIAIATLLNMPAMAQPSPAQGGGIDATFAQDEMSPVQRQEILQTIAINRARLEEQGLLPARGVAAAQSENGIAQLHDFEWPTTTTADDPGHYGISNFVDLDPLFPNQLEDFNCGTRTYDLASGYNHRGIDIFSWPFPWLKMDNDEVLVIAAEQGTIVYKSDGNFDRSCGLNDEQWNAVFIQHSDGSVAWYGHLKNSSLTSKSVGQTVSVGETLGVMGSSGSSTGPHLHLEVYDTNDNLIEPFAGTCNDLNASSWWNNQQNYYESGITKLATHSAPPVMNNGCGVTETPNFENQFNPGESFHPAIYLRDELNGQIITLSILRPNGTTEETWQFTPEVPGHYSAAYWYWNGTIPVSASTGQWTWRVNFAGQTEDHHYFVGDTSDIFDDGFEAP